MSHRPLPSHLRAHPSSANHLQSASASSTGASPLLLTRINEKKAELASLKELRDLSAGLADQMQTLEAKLATLADGTEAVAAVLANWGAVLRAIGMASAKIPKPKDADGEEDDEGKKEGAVLLPQTLVRIPTQQAALLPQASGGSAAD
ncbi:DASH complex subunit dad2 [Coniosporium tulheliwenetii]|uniref:DASH complex subunit dad2 n=1 Tax=Coniosporium tulheliwenetii TaxID=3383036 RepID=A0ACC2Z4I1_9PEZI|nr:DASH complex subunit dad2 [Cladosporium sp. JES 115]